MLIGQNGNVLYLINKNNESTIEIRIQRRIRVTIRKTIPSSHDFYVMNQHCLKLKYTHKNSTFIMCNQTIFLTLVGMFRTISPSKETFNLRSVIFFQVYFPLHFF